MPAASSMQPHAEAVALPERPARILARATRGGTVDAAGGGQRHAELEHSVRIHAPMVGARGFRVDGAMVPGGSSPGAARSRECRPQTPLFNPGLPTGRDPGGLSKSYRASRRDALRLVTGRPAGGSGLDEGLLWRRDQHRAARALLDVTLPELRLVVRRSRVCAAAPLEDLEHLIVIEAHAPWLKHAVPRLRGLAVAARAQWRPRRAVAGSDATPPGEPGSRSDSPSKS